MSKEVGSVEWVEDEVYEAIQDGADWLSQDAKKIRNGVLEQVAKACKAAEPQWGYRFADMIEGMKT